MKISFTKMVASGNDFVVTEDRKQITENRSLTSISRQICDRKFGVGADGLLLLEKSKKADIRMRIFNADGSEAEMCGNGARCLALYSARKQRTENRKQKKINIETKAGIIESVVEAGNVKIKLTDPKDIKTDIPLKVNNRNIKVNFINTGVPHTVVFVEGIEKIDVVSIGKSIRYHNKFAPAGTNVDFVEIINKDSIRVRTYERGVEDETLACGTGSVASALIYAVRCTLRNEKSPLCPPFTKGGMGDLQVNVYTKGGEILKVYFDKAGSKFYNIWLEGKASIVYEGEYYV